MNSESVSAHIVAWLKNSAEEAGVKTLIIGVSGGIDSAVTSTLACLTGLPVTVVNMPIHQNQDHVDRSDNHIEQLKNRFPNVTGYKVDLSKSFDALCADLPIPLDDDLANANSRSRLRMTTLYAFANTQHGLVVGTGNKVEDYGVRFFTKFGDGGVDVSPIAELTKSQVFELGRHLMVAEEILVASPSDGLWNDGRTDEDQIGASYDELEWAMSYYDSHSLRMGTDAESFPGSAFIEADSLEERQVQVLRIFAERHEKNAHKMLPPPGCPIPQHVFAFVKHGEVA